MEIIGCLLLAVGALITTVDAACSDPGTVADASTDLVGQTEGDTVTYTCDAGFKVQGAGSFTRDDTRTCTSGSWTGSATVCEAIACPAPATVAAADQAGTDDSYDARVIYTCHDGYRTPLGGRTTELKCQADETWDKAEPTCNRVQCPTPEDIGHATRNDNQPFLYEDTVTYECDDGFEQTYGDLELVCAATVSWNGTWPTCSRKSCGDPGEIDNAARILTGIKFENYVRYTCFSGYERDTGGGSLNRTCQANSTWSGDQPACIGVLCGQPVEPVNSTRIPENATFRYPDSVRYQCNVGFRPDFSAGGINEISCKSDRTWDFPVMDCTKIHCIETNQSVNAVDAPGTFYYDETKTFTCKPGYQLATGNLERYCQADGTFTGEVPVCERLVCAALVDPARSTREGTDEKYLDSVTYTCDPGYQVQGEINSFMRVLFCQANGQWTASVPVCEPLDCGMPSLGSHVIVASQTGTGFTDTIDVTCEDGYKIQSGELTRTCQANKTWSGDVAVCTPVSCGQPPSRDHVTRLGNNFNFPSRVYYTCSSGYVLAPGTTSNEFQYSCQLNETWGGDSGLPDCVPVECFKPEKINGATLLNDSSLTYTYQQRIVYECDFGTEFNNITGGPLERTCEADRRWSGKKPACPRKSCGDPGTREGSYKLGFSFLYADTVNYTCQAGYEVASGKSWSVVTCEEDQTWTGEFPNCKKIKCPDPGVGDHSTRTVHGLEFQDTIDYRCDEGYRVASGIYKLECTEDRSWTYPMPQCVQVENINSTEKVNATKGPPVESETSNLIGKICIICMSVEFGVMVLLDLTTVWKDVRICVKNVKHGIRRMKGKGRRSTAEDKVAPLPLETE